MPPQDETTLVSQSPAAGSYWDSPPEEKLQGKTLSTLSLSGLERVDHGNHEEPQKQEGEEAQPSYWDEPPEDKLKGKTLSTLSLSGLQRAEHGGTRKQEEKQQQEQQKGSTTAASYWDEPAEAKLQGKTLSTLSLSGLQRAEHGNHEEPTPSSTQKGGGYWDDWQENIKKSLSKMSLSDLVHGSSAARSSTATAATEASSTTGEDDDDEDKEKKDNDQESNDMKRKPSNNSFWFWPNPSMSNLQDAKEQPQSSEEGNPPATIARKPSGAGGYWFWRNPSANNLTNGQNSDSTVSLETLNKNARASDRSEGQQGPISNLQHKMRTTWRASFQKLSSNTLSALDESTASANQEQQGKKASGGGLAEGWKEDFAQGESGGGMKRNDSFIVHEEDGEEGMTF